MSASDVVLRRYSAATFKSALDLYEADLANMAEAGWYPITQVWGWDPVGSAEWVISGSSWRPGNAVLAVTYRRGAPTPPQASSA